GDQHSRQGSQKFHRRFARFFFHCHFFFFFFRHVWYPFQKISSHRTSSPHLPAVVSPWSLVVGEPFLPTTNDQRRSTSSALAGKYVPSASSGTRELPHRQGDKVYHPRSALREDRCSNCPTTSKSKAAGRCYWRAARSPRSGCACCPRDCD